MSKQDFFYWWTDEYNNQNILNLETQEKQLAVYCAHINCMRSENNSSQVEIESNSKIYKLYFFYNGSIIYGYVLDDKQKYDLHISYTGKSQKPMFELCAKQNIILTDSEEDKEEEEEEEYKEDKVPIGMINTGNKCYNISVLQCLIHCTEDFLSEIFKTQDNEFIGKFLNFVSQKKYDNKIMNDFYSEFNKQSQIFEINREQKDSAEFIFYLFQIIENEILPSFINMYKNDYTIYDATEIVKSQNITFDNLKRFINSIPKNPIKSFFNIYSIKKTTYTECNNKFKISLTSNTMLILPVEETKEKKDIKNSIALYCKELESDDKCKIENGEEICKGNQSKLNFYSNCTNKELLSEYVFPNILIIQLKIFNFDKRTNMSNKINCNLEINKDLQFYGRISNDIINDINQKKLLNYTLSGVVCHSGSNINSGHYISYINKNGIWYECNDETINPIEKLNINYKFTPYILFYRKI